MKISKDSKKWPNTKKVILRNNSIGFPLTNLELADLSVEWKRVEKHRANEGDVSSLAEKDYFDVNEGHLPTYLWLSFSTYNRFPSCY